MQVVCLQIHPRADDKKQCSALTNWAMKQRLEKQIFLVGPSMPLRGLHLNILQVILLVDYFEHLLKWINQSTHDQLKNKTCSQCLHILVKTVANIWENS